MPWRRKWQPILVSCLENPIDRGAWWAILHGVVKSDTTEQVTDTHITENNLKNIYICFPSGASGKEPTCQCRRHKRSGFDPWVGKIPWRKAWQPTPVFLPGESEEAGRLQSRVTKSWTRLKGLSMHAYIYILLLASQFHFDKVSLY